MKCRGAFSFCVLLFVGLVAFSLESRASGPDLNSLYGSFQSAIDLATEKHDQSLFPKFEITTDVIKIKDSKEVIFAGGEYSHQEFAVRERNPGSYCKLIFRDEVETEEVTLTAGSSFEVREADSKVQPQRKVPVKYVAKTTLTFDEYPEVVRLECFTPSVRKIDSANEITLNEFSAVIGTYFAPIASR